MDEWCIISKSIHVLRSVILHPTNTSITHFLNMCTRHWHLSIVQKNISCLVWAGLFLDNCIISSTYNNRLSRWAWRLKRRISLHSDHERGYLDIDFSSEFWRIPLIVQKIPQWKAVPLPFTSAVWLSTPSSPLTNAGMFCWPGKQTSEGEKRKFNSFLSFRVFDRVSKKKEINERIRTFQSQQATKGGKL